MSLGANSASSVMENVPQPLASPSSCAPSGGEGVTRRGLR
jgi:hypothetical protein